MIIIHAPRDSNRALQLHDGSSACFKQTAPRDSLGRWISLPDPLAGRRQPTYTCIYIYIYIQIYIHTYIHTYIYKQREKQIDREREYIYIYRERERCLKYVIITIITSVPLLTVDARQSGGPSPRVRGGERDAKLPHDRNPKSYPHPRLQDFTRWKKHRKAQDHEEQPGGRNPGMGISFWLLA